MVGRGVVECDRFGEELEVGELWVKSLDGIEGIQQGLDDFEQGRFSSFEDFIAEQNEKHGLLLEA
jgi:hypothetical protein